MHLTNIFEDIKKDFDKMQYINSNVLSRRFVFQNRITIIVNVRRNNFLGEIGCLLPSDFSLDELKELPKWKGMEQRVSVIPDDGKSRQFLFFLQLPDYEYKIFSIVMQDIVDNLEKSFKPGNIIEIIHTVFNKWNTFFQFEDDYILSENKQQGLYGELYFLERLIRLRGKGTVNSWTGCNSEAHDFYIDTNAIEVKSSSTKGPAKVIISNEFQLDSNGLLGKLYLLYLNLRKSGADGERLPKIVLRICNIIDENEKIEFLNKLLKLGYIYQMPELYKIYFSLRDESFYEVIEGFPRITPKTLSKGIGSVDYTLSLDACNQYQITVEKFYKGVKKN